MGASLQDSHVRPNLHSSTGTGGGGFGSQTASFYQAQSDLRELVTLAVKTDAILRSCDQNGSSTVTKTIYIHRYKDMETEAQNLSRDCVSKSSVWSLSWT